MTTNEALKHIAQVFESVDPGDRIILLMEVIEDQANGHYLKPSVFINMLRERIEQIDTSRTTDSA